MPTPGGAADAPGSVSTAGDAPAATDTATEDVHTAGGERPGAISREEAKRRYDRIVFDTRRDFTELVERRGNQITDISRLAGIGGDDVRALLPEFYCLMLFPDDEISEIKTAVFDTGEQRCCFYPCLTCGSHLSSPIFVQLPFSRAVPI